MIALSLSTVGRSLTVGTIHTSLSLSLSFSFFLFLSISLALSLAPHLCLGFISLLIDSKPHFLHCCFLNVCILPCPERIFSPVVLSPTHCYMAIGKEGWNCLFFHVHGFVSLHFFPCHWAVTVGILASVLKCVSASV